MQPDVQLLALFCGHFLGDFIFQTDRLVALKSEKKAWIAFHVALVSLISWLFLGNLLPLEPDNKIPLPRD